MTINRTYDFPVAPSPGHDVQFYESDAALVATVAAYLGEGLRRGEGLAVVATREHWSAIRKRLADEGAPLDEATRSGRIVVLDAARTLRCIQVGGTPDEVAFSGLIGSTFDMILSLAPSARVRAYGDLVDLLWNDGQRPGALALEQLWNELLARRPAPLLCACSVSGSDSRDRSAICAAHDHVAPAASCAIPGRSGFGPGDRAHP